MKEMTSEQQRAYDIRRRRAFGELLRTEGWKYLEEWLNTRLTDLGGTLMAPLDEGVNAAARQEHVKGTMYAFTLVRDLPRITIDATDDIHGEDEPAGEINED